MAGAMEKSAFCRFLFQTTGTWIEIVILFHELLCFQSLNFMHLAITTYFLKLSWGGPLTSPIHKLFQEFKDL